MTSYVLWPTPKHYAVLIYSRFPHCGEALAFVHAAPLNVAAKHGMQQLHYSTGQSTGVLAEAHQSWQP